LSFYDENKMKEMEPKAGRATEKRDVETDRDLGETVDLNGDVGEGYGHWRAGDDEALLAIVSSANIACGFHAGDPHVMRRTVEACLRRGVAIGAHPGLPDRLGFGRREMAVSPQEVEDFVLYQTGALLAFTAASGGRLAHVKPHGALYHMAARRPDIAAAVARAVYRLDPGLLLFVPPESELERAGRAIGLRVVVEGFADRGYAAGGELAPRGTPGAEIGSEEEALRQALALTGRGTVRTVDGGEIALRAETICVHGDRPRAAKLAASLRRGLEAAGIRIVSPASAKPPSR